MLYQQDIAMEFVISLLKFILLKDLINVLPGNSHGKFAVEEMSL
jgi:hypothetical protein